MKLTRKSYNRRIYVFGIIMFLSIALMSTGFATWVMSKNTTDNVSGDITVGKITDGSISFGKDITVSDKFRFEPQIGDSEGDIIYKAPAEGGEATHANLEVVISGTVSPSEYFSSLSVIINENDLPAGIIAASEKNYLELPECYKNSVTLTTESKQTLQDATSINNIVIADGVVNFKYAVSFKWGSFFDGTNPSVFLDQPNVKEDSTVEGGFRDYTFEEKKDILIDFRRTVYQLGDAYDGDAVMSYTPDTPLKYKVTLTAEAKV